MEQNSIEIPRNEWEKLIDRIDKLDKEVSALKSKVNNLPPQNINQNICQNRYGVPYENTQQQSAAFSNVGVQQNRYTISDADRSKGNSFSPSHKQAEEQFGEADYFANDHLIDIPFKKTTNKINVEYIIGSSFMGILAAILIFVGIAAFVDFLGIATQIVRALLMYMVSIAFMTVGYVFVKRNKNPFSISVLGCGVGAIYVSTIISTFGLKVINPIIAIALMVAASFLTVLISKDIESEQFKLIGFTGLSVAVLLVVCSEYRLNLFFLFLMLWLYTIFNLLLGSHYLRTKNWSYYLIYTVSYLIQNILTISLCYSLYEAGRSYLAYSASVIAKMDTVTYTPGNFIWIGLITLSLFIINYLKLYSFADRCLKEVDNSFKLMTTYGNILIFTAILMGSIIAFIHGWSLWNSNLQIITDCIWIIFVIYGYFLLNISSIARKSVAAYPVSLSLLLLIFINIDIRPILAVLILTGIICLECFGVLRTKRKYELISLTVITFNIVFIQIMIMDESILCIPVLVFSMLLWFITWNKSRMVKISLVKQPKNSLYFKIVAYLVSHMAALGIALVLVKSSLFKDEEFAVVAYFALVALLLVLFDITNIATSWERIDSPLKLFNLNRNVKELDASHNINFIVHLLILALGLFIFLPEMTNMYSLILATILLLIATVDIKYIFDNSILVETELIITYYKVLNNYLPNYPYMASIALIIIAIISIMAGNRYNFRNFRIYGLSLAIFSVFKLIVFDIREAGSKAVGMLFAGVLCLVIVYLYNKGSKKLE